MAFQVKYWHLVTKYFQDILTTQITSKINVSKKVNIELLQ